MRLLSHPTPRSTGTTEPVRRAPGDRGIRAGSSSCSSPSPSSDLPPPARTPPGPTTMARRGRGGSGGAGSVGRSRRCSSGEMAKTARPWVDSTIVTSASLPDLGSYGFPLSRSNNFPHPCTDCARARPPSKQLDAGLEKRRRLTRSLDLEVGPPHHVDGLFRMDRGLGWSRRLGLALLQRGLLEGELYENRDHLGRTSNTSITGPARPSMANGRAMPKYILAENINAAITVKPMTPIFRHCQTR